jgi:hypothetical protein
MYDMLVFALEYHEAIDELTGDRDMRKYELDEDEWALVDQLCNLLKVCPTTHRFIHATHVIPDLSARDPFFSRSTPSLATMIPAMDHIDSHLAEASEDLTYSPAIRAAMALGKTHLNKYYDMKSHVNLLVSKGM